MATSPSLTLRPEQDDFAVVDRMLVLHWRVRLIVSLERAACDFADRHNEHRRRARARGAKRDGDDDCSEDHPTDRDAGAAFHLNTTYTGDCSSTRASRRVPPFRGTEEFAGR